jgi:hypothetical protein
MSERSGGNSLFGKLLWPERTPVSETERELAATRISRARTTGILTDDQARQRHDLLPGARTRADLREALDGLPGAAPGGLLIVRRVFTALWLAVSIIQLCIWVLVCVIGAHFASPFWLWTVVGGAVIVGGLWWVTESEYRTRSSA